MQQLERRIGIRLTQVQWQQLVDAAQGAGFTPSTVIRSFVEQPDLLMQVIERIQLSSKT
uniref:Uncharacterized protein n=1 Tax=Lyngbya confervoides BDU141951 TaxID=1574623 RepID=A0A8T6QU30_9CYAN